MLTTPAAGRGQALPALLGRESGWGQSALPEEMCGHTTVMGMWALGKQSGCGLCLWAIQPMCEKCHGQGRAAARAACPAHHPLWRPSCGLAELSCELRLELPRLKYILHPNNNFSAPKQVLLYRRSKSAISLHAHFSGLWDSSMYKDGVIKKKEGINIVLIFQ